MKVSIKADGHAVDDTGYVWTFLRDADEPERIVPGAVVVAGDPDEPFMARVVDIVTDDPSGESIVHLAILGVPEEFLEELTHAGATGR